MSAEANQEFLEVKEAAQLVRLSVRYLHQQVKLRAIPFIRHGRRLIFSRRQLVAWSESKTVMPQSAGESNNG